MRPNIKEVEFFIILIRLKLLLSIV